MSGNWITEIENMHICPCCKSKTIIDDVHIAFRDKKPILVIKFTHQYENQTEISLLQELCECFEESGGYWVYIPLAEDIKQISQEWY